jgi:hypothetical protein
MHDEIKALQRRLEHFKKPLVVVDNENALFMTAITGSHAHKGSIQLATVRDSLASVMLFCNSI